MRERWDRFHNQIREKGNFLFKDFYVSEPETLEEIPGGTIFYASIGKENEYEIPEGIYGYTNLTPENPKQLRDMANKVAHHVAKRWKSVDKICGHTVFDLTSMIYPDPYKSDEDGTLIIKLGDLPYPLIKVILDELCKPQFSETIVLN
ncbi:MAG: hypothetical protein A2152_00875 [Candidatus Levybacteria bacterium RBG_16_35_6]|nr:MAG: hypothetical protein A2152_00875 [Candidatus Levybacteria bacterium RBG_16_35_6]